MSEENKAIYQRYVDFLNTGDESILSEVVAEDCVDHNPFPRQAPGRAGCLQAGHMLRQALPDLKATVEDIVASGDRVMGRWQIVGTNEGSLYGMPPTGKQITVQGMDIVRIADGKIVEEWTNRDNAGLMMQIRPPIPQGAQQ